MSSPIVDITPLVEAEAAQEPVVAEETPVETPEAHEVETPEVDEGKSEEVSEGKPEVEPEPDEVKSEPEKVKAKDLTKGINEKLQQFYKEARPTPEGKELLQKINEEVNSLYKQVQTEREAAGDVQSVVANAKELHDLVTETDSLLYAGDPKLIDNIVEDLKAEDHFDSFAKLGAAWVERMKTETPEEYYANVVAPAYQHALEQTGMISAVRGLIKAYNSGDNKALRGGIEAIARHIAEVNSKVAEREESAAKVEQSNAQESQRTEFENELRKTAMPILGAALKPILQSTELKSYKRENLLVLSKEIMRATQERFDQDSTYTKLFNAAYKRGDTAECKRLADVKLKQIAESVVSDTVKRMYPNLTTVEKKAAPALKTVKTVAGPAVRVKTKPQDLDRSMKDSAILEINGVGYTKINGKRTLVTWR